MIAATQPLLSRRRALGRRRPGPWAHRVRGSTYIAVLMFLAVTGAMLASAATIWSHQSARAKEAQLLWVGNEFRDAIALYYLRSPGTQPVYPNSLDDLLEDRRFLSLQRYLRRMYRDPISGEVRWGTVPAPAGGIMGVYSLAEGRPIKQRGFAQPLAHFEGATQYSQWQFVFVPPANPTAVPARR